MIITGCVTAFLVFALKEFFTLSHRNIPLSFAPNFLYLFFREAFLPIVLLYAVFFLLSKDDLDFKLEAFFPLVTSFYVVFLPYIVITSPETKTAFEVLAKPVLFTSLLVSLSQGVSYIQNGLKGKKGLIAVGIILILVSFCIPAAAESFFLMDSPAIYVILLILFSVILTSLNLFIRILRK